MGTVRLYGVHFEGQGDDGLNVHGVFHDVRDLHAGSPGLLTLGSRPAGGTSGLNAGEMCVLFAGWLYPSQASLDASIYGALCYFYRLALSHELLVAP